MEENIDIVNEQIKAALIKQPLNRSYDDLLLLKSWISRTEFMMKNLDGIVNPQQMNDICRNMELQHYSDGDVVFRQGDDNDKDKKVFILLSGSCDLKVMTTIDLTQGMTENREKHVLTYNKRGQYFGERAIQFNEARAGTVICTEETDLVTLSKKIYLDVITDAQNQLEMSQAMSIANLGTKESVLKVLAKMKDKRNNKELDATAQYLLRRIPFFQKFNMEQLVELCRVAETVSVWGRTILFKQGQKGQAFYVVLSGTVEVWVNNERSTPASRGNKGAVSDLTLGLGEKVNELVSGDIFGERALESEDSLRMASIVTCDSNTELIVISREDYHNLVYIMMHEDSMNRLSLLRKTELFRSVDVMHLKGLARFMEPRQFQINEVLYSVGTKASEIIIIESGECRVETQIKEGFAPDVFVARNVHLTTPHYMDGTHQQDGTYHEGEEGVTPFHEDPYHQNHPELAHRHPADASETPKTSPVPSPRRMNEVISKVQNNTKIDKRDKSTSVKPQTPSQLQKHTSLNKLGSGEAEDDIEKQAERVKVKRRRKDRLLSTDMVQLGKTKTLNLGRIAPYSVLATYVARGTLGDEVFHPETVVASTLVTAYSIGKHDFFNHLPRDTHNALVKLMNEFKPPELHFLWQNAPRQLDEDQWKKEKTWRMFRKKIVKSGGKNKSIDILDTFRTLKDVHLSANSGNDNFTYVNIRNRALVESRELRITGTLNKGVTSKWGLKAGINLDAYGNIIERDVAISEINHEENSGALKETAAGSGSTAVRMRGSSAQRREKDKQNVAAGGSLNKTSSGDLLPGTGDENYRYQPRGLVSNDPSPALVSNAVSQMIRQRITNDNSFQGTALKRELFSMPSINDPIKPSSLQQTSALTTEELLHDSSALNIPSVEGGENDSKLREAVLRRQQEKAASLSEVKAFHLIQIHRETARKSGQGGLLDVSKRRVRCYIRLCGGHATCDGAKQLAALQMEHARLTLFRSDSHADQELLLRWTPFKGFDALSLSDSDHFLIYCRGTPIHCASINPSKNIFNALFPAICKPKHQRYACVLTNPLPKGKRNHQHRHHDSTENEESNSDSSEEEETRRNRKEHKSRHHHKHKKHNHKHEHHSHHHRHHKRKDDSQTATATTGNLAASATSPAAAAATTSSNETSNSNAAVATASNETRISTYPEYLLEFSVINEVLLTFESRLECLRYAINRFGSLTNPNSNYDVKSTLSHFKKDDVDQQGAGLTLQQVEKAMLQYQNSKHISKNGHFSDLANSKEYDDKGKIFLKSLVHSQPDRVLALLHHGRKVCIMPLFNWIFINEDTVNTLDFINGFNDFTAKMVLMEEEVEHSRITASTFGKPNRKAVVGGTSGAMVKMDPDNPLYKSFQEVGLLHADQPSDDDGSGEEEPDEFQGMDKDIKIEKSSVATAAAIVAGQEKAAKTEKLKLVNSLSLQFLERDMAATELTHNILSSSHPIAGELLMGDSSDAFNTTNFQLTDSRYWKADLKSNTAAFTRTGDRYHSHTAALESRLKALNQQVQSCADLLKKDQLLCDQEGALAIQHSQFSPNAKLDRDIAKLAPKNIRAIEESKWQEIQEQKYGKSKKAMENIKTLNTSLNSPPRLPQDNSKERQQKLKQKALATKRMEVIESLQKQKLTLRSAILGFKAPSDNPIEDEGMASNEWPLEGSSNRVLGSKGSIVSDSDTDFRMAGKSRGISMVKGGAGISIPKAVVGSDRALGQTRLTLSRKESQRLASAGGGGIATTKNFTANGKDTFTVIRDDGVITKETKVFDSPSPILSRYGKGYATSNSAGARLGQSIEALSSDLSSRINL